MTAVSKSLSNENVDKASSTLRWRTRKPCCACKCPVCRFLRVHTYVCVCVCICVYVSVFVCGPCVLCSMKEVSFLYVSASLLSPHLDLRSLSLSLFLAEFHFFYLAHCQRLRMLCAPRCDPHPKHARREKSSVLFSLSF